MPIKTAELSVERKNKKKKPCTMFKMVKHHFSKRFEQPMGGNKDYVIQRN